MLIENYSQLVHSPWHYFYSPIFYPKFLVFDFLDLFLNIKTRGSYIVFEVNIVEKRKFYGDIIPESLGKTSKSLSRDTSVWWFVPHKISTNYGFRKLKFHLKQKYNEIEE